MNTFSLNQVRYTIVLVLLALLLALVAFAAPVVIDTVAGTALVEQVYACPGGTGGC